MTDAPPPPPPDPSAASTPAATPAAPAAAPKPVKPGSATTLIWRRRDRVVMTGALTTVIVGWGIEIARQLLILIQSISYAINDGPQYILEGFGDFAFYGLWRPLFFFGLAFLALWMFLPVVKESTLPRVMTRAAAAGVAGLAGLILFGIVQAIFDIVRYGFAFGYFSVTWLWNPILTALVLTAFLVIGAVVAWLRAQRAPKVVPAA